jgi:hypothetical protein
MVRKFKLIDFEPVVRFGECRTHEGLEKLDEISKFFGDITDIIENAIIVCGDSEYTLPEYFNEHLILTAFIVAKYLIVITVNAECQIETWVFKEITR